MSDDGRTPTRSERVYRVMLKAYPKEFRDEYGAHMAQAFGDLRRREIERAGTDGLVALWVRTLVDLLLSASAERSRTVAPVLSSSGMIRFGGLAAMVGGALGAMLVVQPIAVPYGGPFGRLAWLLQPLDLLGTISGLLISAAALGLYACVATGSPKLAALGLGLASISAVVFAGMGIYGSLVAFSSDYPGGPGTPIWVIEVASSAGFAGSLLLGAALIRTRALGRWSALPLVLWLLPVVAPSLFWLLSEAWGLRSIWLGAGVVFGLPALLGNLGWMLVGYLLWSGRLGRTEGPTQTA